MEGESGDFAISACILTRFSGLSGREQAVFCSKNGFQKDRMSEAAALLGQICTLMGLTADKTLDQAQISQI